MLKKIFSVVALLLVAGLYLGEPVYQFYAHRGKVPMPFWGYVDIPQDIPSRNEVHQAEYQQAAESALTLLKAHRQKINTPGISAAVAIDGEVVWAGTAGWADIADNRPLTPDSQFRIGSTSKALTATLFARMVQDEKLTLDTPLNQLTLGSRNPHWQNITPRQLASHTAGLPHYKENTEAVGLYRSIALNSSYRDVLDAVALFDDSDMLFSPGEDFSYSSYGTVLLSAVLQETGGKPYQTLMQETVLKPLTMVHTTPTTVSVHAEQEAANLATFYWREDESLPRVRPWRDVDLSHRLAGGGFISTPSDLVKLGSGFINNDFISEPVRAAFWTPQTLNNGDVNEQHYAIGWRVHDSDLGEGIGKVKIANHGGVSRGSQSWLMVIPQYRMAIAVNINSKTETFWDFGRISFPLARTFILSRTSKDQSLSAPLKAEN